MKISRKLWVLPPVLLGAAYLAWTVKTRVALEPTRLEESSRAVEVQLIEPRAVVPTATGYGEVVPDRVWRALAEVSGRVQELNPLLKPGEIIVAGTQLVTLDVTDYELALARLQAEIQGVQAELAVLEVASDNTRASLEISRRTVVLAERELERLKTLFEDGNVSQSAVDAQEQALLRENSNVVTLESSLRSDEANRSVQRARLEASNAQLAQAQRDLERTAIVAPFDCRISLVDVETAQYVAAGATLFEAYGIEKVEIEAQLAISRVRQLIRPERVGPLLEALGRGELWNELGISAEVRLHGTGFTVTWPARFARVAGALDPVTRTVGMVASVDQPYRRAAGSGKPALVKGMFVEVVFRGEPLPDRLVVPLTAIHDGRVYLVDDDLRLRLQPVEVEFVVGDDAVLVPGLVGGLVGGERLVLTDLIPAIPGMLLAPTDALLATMDSRDSSGR